MFLFGGLVDVKEFDCYSIAIETEEWSIDEDVGPQVVKLLRIAQNGDTKTVGARALVRKSRQGASDGIRAVSSTATLGEVVSLTLYDDNAVFSQQFPT